MYPSVWPYNSAASASLLAVVIKKRFSLYHQLLQQSLSYVPLSFLHSFGIVHSLKRSRGIWQETLCKSYFRDLLRWYLSGTIVSSLSQLRNNHKSEYKGQCNWKFLPFLWWWMLLILISKLVYVKYVFVLWVLQPQSESLFKTRSEKCSVEKHDVSCHNLLHSHSHQSMHFHCCRACTNVTKGSNRVPCNLTLFATKMVLHSTGALLLLCARKESCILYGYFLVPDSLIHHSSCSSPNTIAWFLAMTCFKVVPWGKNVKLFFVLACYVGDGLVAILRCWAVTKVMGVL